MTKIDIISGFLGAGKTTLIKKLIREAFTGEKLVLIENEFGEIGIDGGFLQEAGIQVNELNSGCICCSLVGDFREALKKVIAQYAPDRILIEPSGVGKLSDVTRAVEAVAEECPVQLHSFVTVADVNKVKLYTKNFGEFYNDQISHASCIIFSRTQTAAEAKVAASVALIKEKNPDATIVTTPWDDLTGPQLAAAMSSKNDFVAQLLAMAEEANAHAHDHHDHDEHCHCAACEAEHDHEGHEHHHHEHDHAQHHHEHDREGHEHHHHAHDEHCHCPACEAEHEHHHDHAHEHHHHEHAHDHHHDEHCGCGHDHHEHDHHHHHHADEVFTSWGVETAKKFSEADIRAALDALDSGKYGMILRSKGIVDGPDGWLEFDYVPGEGEIRHRSADITGKLVVIGAQLDEAGAAALFGL